MDFLEAARARDPDDTDLVIVIDQFEELFIVTTHEAIAYGLSECIPCGVCLQLPRQPRPRDRDAPGRLTDRPAGCIRCFGELLAAGRREAIPPAATR